MELFNLEVSKWDISLETYLGDLYLYHRAWILILGVAVALRLVKVIRLRNNKRVEPIASSSTSLWED